MSSFTQQRTLAIISREHGDDRRDLRNAYDAGFSSEGSYDEWDPLGGYDPYDDPFNNEDLMDDFGMG